MLRGFLFAFWQSPKILPDQYLALAAMAAAATLAAIIRWRQWRRMSAANI